MITSRRCVACDDLCYFSQKPMFNRLSSKRRNWNRNEIVIMFLALAAPEIVILNSISWLILKMTRWLLYICVSKLHYHGLRWLVTCLVPSHYANRFGEQNANQKKIIIIWNNHFENVVCKMSAFYLCSLNVMNTQWDSILYIVCDRPKN